MVKRNITLYLDSEAVEIARLKKINISKLCDEAIKQVANIELPKEDEEMKKERTQVEIENAELRARIEHNNKILKEFAKKDEEEERKRRKSILKTITVNLDR